MAYRSKKRGPKKGKTTRRRRRVSGINKNSPLITIAAAVGGYFIAPKINTFLTDKLGAKVDPKLIAAGEVLIGWAIPKFVLKNSLPGKLLGGVLMGAGVNEGLKALGVISGFANVPTIAGYRDLRSIAGLPYTAPHGSAHNSNRLSAMQVISGICNTGRL